PARLAISWMTVVRLGWSTPKRTVSASAARRMRGLATAAAPDIKRCRRLIIFFSPVVRTNPCSIMWLSHDPLMASQPAHHVGQLAAQFIGLRRIAIAWPIHIHGHILPNTTG